jgi:hypothetical protein
MARKPSDSSGDDPFTIKMKPYEEALADLKEAIERHVNKEAKRHWTRQDVRVPTAYRFISREE